MGGPKRRRERLRGQGRKKCVCWKVVRLPWSGMDRWSEVCGRGDEFRLHTGFLPSQEEILILGQLSLFISVFVPLSLFVLIPYSPSLCGFDL